MGFDLWSLGAVIFLLAIAGWGIRLLRQRVEDQRYREHLSEMEFEQTLFPAARSDDHESQDMVFLQNIPASQELKSAGFSADLTSTPAVGVEGPLPADVAAQTIVKKLTLSGLLRSVEGYIEVHGNPKGAAILSLRNGKRALLVPHMESEPFFRRHARRVDMIIVMGPDGAGLVVTPLEELLADNMSVL